MIESEFHITFGKDRYHLISDMISWCDKHIGKGGWIYSIPDTQEELGNKNWGMRSIFGTTTVAFKDSKDLTAFVLKWM